MSSVTLLLFSLHINVLVNIIISAIVYIGILILFKEQLFKEVAEIIGLNKLDFLTKKLVRK
jgi:hypothetical protein